MVSAYIQTLLDVSPVLWEVWPGIAQNFKYEVQIDVFDHVRALLCIRYGWFETWRPACVEESKHFSSSRHNLGELHSTCALPMSDEKVFSYPCSKDGPIPKTHRP